MRFVRLAPSAQSEAKSLDEEEGLTSYHPMTLSPHHPP